MAHADDDDAAVVASSKAKMTKRKSNRSLTDQTVAGLSWQFLGTAAELVIRISVMVILARLLTAAEFGVAAAASVAISFSQIFATLGVGQSVVQRRDLTDDQIRAGFAFSVWSGVAIALLMFACAPLIAAGFKMPTMRWPVAVLALVFLFTGPSIVAIALSQRERAYKRIATIDSLTFTIAYLFIGVGLAYAGFGLWALVLAQLLQTILRSAIFLFVQRHPKALFPRWSDVSVLLNSGLGYSLGSVGNFMATNGDNFAVGRLLGASALGVYGRAYQFLMVPTNLFGAVVDKVLFPAMAHVQGDPIRLTRAFRRSLASVAMIVMPVSGVLCVLAPELVTLTLGSHWSDVIMPFQVLAITMLFRTSYKMSDSLARATGNVYRRAWRQWAYAGFVTVGAVAGSRWGVPGVAAGVGLAIAFNFFMMLQLSVSITSIPWSVVCWVHLRCAAAAVPVIVLTALTAWWTRLHFGSPLVTVAASGAAAATIFCLQFFWHKKIYGADGEWIVELAMRLVRKRFNRA